MTFLARLLGLETASSQRKHHSKARSPQEIRRRRVAERDVVYDEADTHAKIHRSKQLQVQESGEEAGDLDADYYATPPKRRTEQQPFEKDRYASSWEQGAAGQRSEERVARRRVFDGVEHENESRKCISDHIPTVEKDGDVPGRNLYKGHVHQHSARRKTKKKATIDGPKERSVAEGSSDSNLRTASSSRPNKPHNSRYNPLRYVPHDRHDDTRGHHVYEQQHVQKVRTDECSICLDSFNHDKLAKLSCAHTWCGPCLRRTYFFTEQIPIVKPLECCSQQIPLQTISFCLSHSERKVWDRKVRELATERPLYCPTPSCNNYWISPSHYSKDSSGRKVAECSLCRKRVCRRCRLPAHWGKEKCKGDEARRQLDEWVEGADCRKCPKCRRLVERISGCNHMTCICSAQFCWTCGTSYSSAGVQRCNCSFEYRLFDHRLPTNDDDEADDAWEDMRPPRWPRFDGGLLPGRGGLHVDDPHPLDDMHYMQLLLRARQWEVRHDEIAAALAWRLFGDATRWFTIE